MMLESIKNGPLVYLTIEENGQIREKKYAEITEQEQLQDNCDVQATNIVLQGLSPDLYSLINHSKVDKDIWDRVKLLMQGTGMSYQERECKLYNEFDDFTSVKVQVNTKFLNAFQPEWSKFVTNVKLAKNLYTTNYDQLYAYLSQHEGHANEVRLLREIYLDHLVLVPNHQTLSHSSHTSSSTIMPTSIPNTNQSYTTISSSICDDLIACPNKAMAFMSTVMASRFLSTNNQLRTSSNLRNQATIQDGRGEGHMARQCTRPKRPTNSTWFQEKMLLVQTDDLDAYDSHCDDTSLAKAILMANLSSYDSDVPSEVTQHDTYQNDDMLNQSVQDTQYFE
ncbi:hypothetical protein Tco_0950422 [Tanacetum coccineum]